jgi:hypothetical protein
VPLFYYLLHVPLIHGVQVIVAKVMGIQLAPSFFIEKNFGFELAIVYAIWAGIVLALYPICLWYSRKKAASRNPWLSYL